MGKKPKNRIDQLSKSNSNGSLSKSNLHSSNGSLENGWVYITLNNGLKKKWIEDSDVNACKKCNEPFSLWIRRHHCRNCGQIFCYNCCQKFRQVTDPVKIENDTLSVGMFNNIFDGSKDYKLARVCNDCSLSIDRQTEKYRLWYIFSFLDLKEIKNLMPVCKLYHQVAMSYIRALTQIQSYPLDRELTIDERSMIIKNQGYLTGHSGYLFALLRADPDYKIENFQRSCVCKNLNCNLGCRDTLKVEDYVVILSTGIFRSLKNDQLVNYCCNEILRLITNEEAETLITLLIERTYLVSVCDLLIKLSERSDKLLYLIYWQSLHNSKILPDKIEQHYFKSNKPQRELINIIKDTYYEFSLINWNRIQNIVNEKGKQFLFMNGEHLFASQSIVEGGLEIKQSKSKPVVLPLRDKNGNIKRFLLKRDNLKKDFIVNRVINLMMMFIKRELNFELDLSPVNYLVYLLKGNQGIIEIVEDSYTIYDIKNNFRTGLQSFILNMNRHEKVETVLDRFLDSLAFYSVATYLLGIGDRHLDNIMVHRTGLVFHIDYEYILGADPKFVSQTMRITDDMLQILGGKQSDDYRRFKNRCTEIFNCLRKHNRIFGCLLSLVADNSLTKHEITKFINDRFEPCERYLNAETYITTIIEKSHDTIKNGVLDTIHRCVKSFR